MSGMFDEVKKIGDDVSFDDLVDFSAEDEMASSVVRDASSEGPQHRLDYRREVSNRQWTIMPPP